ncbi:hypothetical protein IEQ34_007673 [Dendrobium chrysotoxum]|uniref:Uncharacterized protein n=1 Tax=Dendrobium chrysotoxum TaxID=161865 RepID=A0AAV7H219_DENCH|nr:hypothetical protein IEQ34_007673 [Dendrobium chrysotoxum]
MADFGCGFEESFLQEEEPLEERSLNLLKDSKIDQAFAEAKAKKKGGKKHKVKWMRRPMVMPEAILEFLDEDLRENAIRYLSNFLIEVYFHFLGFMNKLLVNSFKQYIFRHFLRPFVLSLFSCFDSSTSIYFLNFCLVGNLQFNNYGIVLFIVLLSDLTCGGNSNSTQPGFGLSPIILFSLQKREEDPCNYNRAGFLLFFSCGTMPTLLQEVVSFYRKMSEQALNVRSIKRLANVLTLFQCIASNNGTRHKFVDACIPDYLIPLIQFDCTIDAFDNIRAIALSVIGILCQAGEPFVIDWAIRSDVAKLCHTILATASELNKVVVWFYSPLFYLFYLLNFFINLYIFSLYPFCVFMLYRCY